MTKTAASFKERGSPIGIALLVVAGCTSGGSCPTITVANTSSANLTGAESRTESSTGQLLDAAAPAPPTFQVTSVSTDLGETTPDADLLNPQCIDVRYDDTKVGFTIAFACPAGPGSYSLAELQATVCQVDADCRSLTGTLTVRTISLPCPSQAKACGQLDATLDVTPPSTPVGPAVSGQAQLTYTETLVPGTCASYPLPE